MLLIALTGLAVAAFGVILYFVGSSVTWFASSPSSDRRFGNLNHCLIHVLPSGRGGFAVAPDGRRAASFSGNEVAICRADLSAPGGAVAERVALSGVTRLAFDLNGALWAATSPTGLWRLPEGAAPVPAGDVSAIALAGHARGVVALDSAGKLVSVAPDGETLGFAGLPRSPSEPVQLSVDAEGALVAVVGEGGVLIYTADTLRPVRAEAPCDVEFLWWTLEPGTALLSCGPDGSWALRFHPRTGTQEEAPRRTRERSTLVPRLGTWVRACDGLPCEAAPPANG